MIHNLTTEKLSTQLVLSLYSQRYMLFCIERMVDVKKIIIWGGLLLTAGISLFVATTLVLSGKNTNITNSKNWTFYQSEGDNDGFVKEGVITLNDIENKAILKKEEYDDFQFDLEVKVSKSEKQKENTNAEAGVLFRIQNLKDNGDGYGGYYFGIDVEKQQVVLGKSNTEEDSWIEIATKKMYFEYDNVYKLTIKVVGNHIQGFVNETENSYPQIDIINEDYVNGQIGVYNHFSQAIFDKMSIVSYQESEHEGATYTNALLSEVADPDILFVDGTYYLYPTTAGRNVGGIKVFTSTDMVNWTDKGMAMSMGEDNWGTNGFWAPDMIERDGKYYMYYTANEHLCVAVADSPLGPFKQIKISPIHEDINEIDAHAFKDDDGKYYLYFVRFNEGNVIWGAKLNDDMMSINESTLTEILVPSQPWELDMASINEGPYMLKKDGIYYLTYSGSHFESPMYGAGYATSTNPLGPFEKYEQNPIMQSNSFVPGAGHHAVATSPDGEEMFMIYHRHESIWNTDPREFAIDRMRFTENERGETVLEVHGPTVTPQPVPSGAVDVDNFIGFASEDLVDKTVKKDQKSTEWSLPEEIGIITSKSVPEENVKVAVYWQLPEDVSSGKMVIKGEVSLPEGIENLGKLSLTPEMTITVE